LRSVYRRFLPEGSSLRDALKGVPYPDHDESR